MWKAESAQMAYREFEDRKKKLLEDAQKREGAISQQEEVQQVEDDAGEGPSRGWASRAASVNDVPPNGDAIKPSSDITFPNDIPSIDPPNSLSSTDGTSPAGTSPDINTLQNDSPPDETSPSDGSPSSNTTAPSSTRPSRKGKERAFPVVDLN